MVAFQLMIYHVVLHVQIPAQSTHGAFITQQESRNALLLSTKMDMMIALLLHTVSMAIMLKKNVLLANTSMLRSVSDNWIKIKVHWTLVSLFTRIVIYIYSAGCLLLDNAPRCSHCNHHYGLNGYQWFVNCTHFETCVGNELYTMACDGDLVFDTTLG